MGGALIDVKRGCVEPEGPRDSTTKIREQST